MLARTAGRLLTGPLAFLVAGIVDVVAFLAAALYARVRSAARR